MIKRLENTYRQIVASAREYLNPQPATRDTGRIVQPLPQDSVRTYVSEGLTPRKLSALLHEWDDGGLDAGMELAEQMEEKDPHLYSVAHTRRLAFTGLPWEIVSAADVDQIKDRKAADDARDYCREQLSRIENLSDVTKHLAKAIGRNLAVAELIWDGSDLADIIAVPGTRLCYLSESPYEAASLRVLTKEEPVRGIPLMENKFIVHTPAAVSGSPMCGGLLRLSAACYVAKAFAMKDWLIFMEVFGMPVRVGRYEPTATPAEKNELLKMLQSLGADAVGIFSKAVELDLVETPSRGDAPYASLAEFLNAELSKAWLGQTLTTEQGKVGSQALGNVHNEVRQDIRNDDIQSEGATIRRDVLRVLTEGGIGPDAPVPYWRRRVDEERDPGDLTDLVDKAVNQLGIRVSKSWYVAQTGIVLAKEDDEEDAIAPRPAPVNPLLSDPQAVDPNQTAKTGDAAPAN